jgi:hypothetical protein
VIRNDVAGGPGLKGADGNDAKGEGVFLTADHGLHIDHETGGDQNRVDRGVGHGAVAAAALEIDLQFVGVGADRPGQITDVAGHIR